MGPPLGGTVLCATTKALLFFPRKLPSGRVVWYYRAYDDSRPDHRTVARSTGQTRKGAAKAYCRDLERRGELVAGPTAPLTFEQFAAGFWDWDNSSYIARGLQFSDPDKPALGRRYADDMARTLQARVMPVFGRRPLADVLPQEVEAWAIRMRAAGLSGKRVNNIVSCLRIILSEAKRASVISFDPSVIRSVGNAPKRRGRLTLDEVRRLFADEAIPTAWRGHLLYRAINLVGATTGHASRRDPRYARRGSARRPCARCPLMVSALRARANEDA